MDNFSVVLVNPRYQGNVGSVARVMKNFGVSNLVLVNPPDLKGKARAMAMHAQDLLDEATVYEDFYKLQEKFDFLVGTSAKIGGDNNHLRHPVFPWDLENSLEITSRIALIFGREDNGLLNQELALCDLLVTIPTSREYPTMNLAQSAAVILYELNRLESDKEEGMDKFREADKDSKDILISSFNELVDGVYEHDFQRRLAKKTYKQVMGRAFISGKEAKNLTGVFRRAYKKITGKIP